MDAAPGDGGSVSEVTYIRGNRIRKDDGKDSSSIMDWDAGILTLVDHPSRSYVRMSLEEMARMAEEAARSMGETADGMGRAADGSREGIQEVQDAYGEGGGDRTNFDVRVSTDRTGRTRKVGGYDAEQVFLTLEIVGETEPEQGGEEAQSGGLAIVTELWLSQDFPEYRMMREMDGAAVDRMKDQQVGKGILASLETLLASDPRMKAALERNEEALAELDGVALKTTMHVVSLPGKTRVDRDAVLAAQDRGLDDDAADAAKDGARGAARSAMGRLGGGLFGRKKKEEEAPPEPEDPQQKVILRVISQISDVEVGKLDASLFQVPADYQDRSVEGGTHPGG